MPWKERLHSLVATYLENQYWKPSFGQCLNLSMYSEQYIIDQVGNGGNYFIFVFPFSSMFVIIKGQWSLQSSVFKTNQRQMFTKPWIFEPSKKSRIALDAVCWNENGFCLWRCIHHNFSSTCIRKIGEMCWLQHLQRHKWKGVCYASDAFELIFFNVPTKAVSP